MNLFEICVLLSTKNTCSNIQLLLIAEQVLTIFILELYLDRIHILTLLHKNRTDSKACTNNTSRPQTAYITIVTIESISISYLNDF